MDLQSDFLKNFKNPIDTYIPIPARYGRIIHQNQFLFIIQLIIYFSVGTVIFMNINKISLEICNLSIKITKILNLPLDFKINQKNIFTFITLYYLSEAGKLPSLSLSFYVLITSLVLILIFNVTKIIPKFLQIWINFILGVSIISCLYFIFYPHKFPYILEDFSLLYVTTSIGIFSIIPFVIGVPLSFLSYRKWLIISNFLVFCLIITYSLVFNIIRYVVFLYVLNKYSLLWMANLYFNFGPLLDTIYISGIWGIYLSFLSKYIQEKPTYWRWLY